MIYRFSNAGLISHYGWIKITVASMAALALTSCGDPYVPPDPRPPAPRTYEPPDPRPPAPRTQVPTELQGTWSGGTTGATAHASYTFGPAGDVAITKGRLQWQGTVVIQQEQMTFYIPGSAPQDLKWSYQACADPSGYGFPHKILFLDGFSYVQDC